jgi:hypothetical protein
MAAARARKKVPSKKIGNIARREEAKVLAAVLEADKAAELVASETLDLDEYYLALEVAEALREDQHDAAEDAADALLSAAEEAEDSESPVLVPSTDTVKKTGGVEIVQSSKQCTVSKLFKPDVARDLADTDEAEMFDGGRPDSKRRRH